MADFFEVFEGETFQQSCIVASSSPQPSVTWRKDGSVLSQGSMDSHSSMDSQVLISNPTPSMSLLIIGDVKRTHGGNYSCEASNGAGTVRQSVFLKVKGIYSTAVIY